MLRSVLKNSPILLLGCFFLLVACAPTGIYHTVQPGQTLYRIAKTYDVDEDHLASINRIKDPTQLRAKQKIFIPNATQVRKVPVTSTPSGVKATRTTTSDSGPKPTPTTSKPVKAPTPTKAAPVYSTKPAKGIFIWPAKGKVLNNFGTHGEKVYKGIEISIPKGTPVVAAASGKVIYSGNAIPGFGNLVILEHSDSYFSVYGYNQKNLVKMEDHVGQGEKIAQSGLPPNGQSARLHFEIRKGKSAVNPILYLP